MPGRAGATGAGWLGAFSPKPTTAMRPRRCSVLLLIVALTYATRPADAQEFPGFGSAEGRVGIVLPDDADTGLSTAIDVGLGYMGNPLLRALVGFHYFTADVVRQFPGGTAAGSISGVGGRAGLRLDLFGPTAFGPYVLGTLTFHNVTVDADVPNERALLRDVFGGFVVGAGLGGGATYALDAAHRFLATAEVRRVFVANIPHWGAEVGVRIVPRGRQAYDRVIRYPWWGTAPRRLE
jgi:hypothetical protein